MKVGSDKAKYHMAWWLYGRVDCSPYGSQEASRENVEVTRDNIYPTKTTCPWSPSFNLAPLPDCPSTGLQVCFRGRAIF